MISNNYYTPRSSNIYGDWQLKALRGMATTPNELKDFTLHLDENGRLSGRDGTNYFNGSSAIDPYTQRLDLALGTTTLIAHADPKMAQLAQRYISLLDNAEGYAIGGNILRLLDANGRPVAAFEKMSNALVDPSRWKLVSYNNGRDAVVSDEHVERVTAMFNGDGTITGTTGEHGYRARFAADEESGELRVAKPRTSPHTVGENNPMEEAFLAALQKATRFDRKGDVLEVRDDTGALMLEFRKAG